MPVDAQTRQEPATTLQAIEVHASWSRHYRTRENDRFYDLAFEHISALFGDPGDDPVVDAGCGSGTKTLQLVKRGYRVTALDFSGIILDQARAAVSEAGDFAAVEFLQADLTALTLASGGARRVLCWGVLMHVPALDRAVAELARVLAPGGTLVISEGNHRSLQAVTLRSLKRLLGRERAEVIHTPAGIEYWEETSTGRLLTRQADIPWLVTEFQRNGLILQERRAGQFSELYTVIPWRFIRSCIHAFNNAWFRWPKAGGPAFGNLLVFRRPL